MWRNVSPHERVPQNGKINYSRHCLPRFHVRLLYKLLNRKKLHNGNHNVNDIISTW